MMAIDNEKFSLLTDMELSTELHDASLTNGWFFACSFGATARTIEERRWTRRVALRRCKATNNCSIGPAFVEDVSIDGLQTGGLVTAWGTAFRRVRLRGRCGTFLLTSLPSTNTSPEVGARFEADNRRFYDETDWALDISEAEVEELDIRSVPADLVRRDPETQVVVRRARVEATIDVWRALDLSGTPWRLSLDYMLQRSMADRVLVAPKRRKDCRRWVEGLRLLQKEGIAEVD